MLAEVRPGGLCEGLSCFHPVAADHSHVSGIGLPLRSPNRMTCVVALSYAMAGRARAGSRTAGVDTGFAQALADGEALADSLAEGVGEAAGPGFDPHATIIRSDPAETSRRISLEFMARRCLRFRSHRAVRGRQKAPLD